MFWHGSVLMHSISKGKEERERDRGVGEMERGRGIGCSFVLILISACQLWTHSTKTARNVSFYTYTQLHSHILHSRCVFHYHQQKYNPEHNCQRFVVVFFYSVESLHLFSQARTTNAVQPFSPSFTGCYFQTMPPMHCALSPQLFPHSVSTWVQHPTLAAVANPLVKTISNHLTHLQTCYIWHPWNRIPAQWHSALFKYWKERETSLFIVLKLQNGAPPP